MMNADYFIQKFEKIPDICWGTKLLVLYDQGIEVCCALGHCGQRRAMRFNEPCETEEASALMDLFHGVNLSVADVNDRPSQQLPQRTPKGRILAALEYIKAQQLVAQ